MRHRPSGTIRCVTNCARCSYRPDLYAVRHVDVPLATVGGTRRHLLVVCRECDRKYETLPTPCEESAMAVDLADSVQCMEFVQNWGCDPARVQRTARHFLGEEAYDREAARIRSEREAQRSRREAQDDEWERQHPEFQRTELDEVW